jgi:hypothetical protein
MDRLVDQSGLADRQRISAVMAVEKAVDRPSKRRRRRATVRFDRRSRTGKRATELERLYVGLIGDAAINDPLIVNAIRRAAEIRAIAESLRARLLRADPAVSPDDLVRCERLAAQAERSLQLDRRDRETKRLPDPATYLADKIATGAAA